MSITTGPVAAEEFDEWFATMGVAFAANTSPEQLERAKRRHRLERSMTARDGDTLVATFGSFPFETTVPGGQLPTSGVTGVAILPTHRRRGIIRRLMVEHFADCLERGEPLATLWASEAAIYGRFGYGLAARHHDLKLTVRPGMFVGAPASGHEFRLAERDEALRIFPGLFDVERQRRPGMFTRDGSWWEGLLSDPPDRREGWSAHRRLVASVDGVDVGYAIFRAKWNDEGRQIVRLSEAFGADDTSERAVWQFLTEIDLVDEVVNWNDPIDRPFDWWLSDPRLAARKVSDALYLRLVDVRAALQERSYQRDGTVTLAVADPVCTWNEKTYRLMVSAGRGLCDVVDDDPDVSVDVAALASAYLGDRSPFELARVGRVTGDTEAISLLGDMLRCDVAAYCQEMF